jgi:hypothetical protein
MDRLEPGGKRRKEFGAATAAGRASGRERVHSTLDDFVILSESWQLPEADAALDGGHTILLPSAA